ncbi:MAG: hypothetical protein ACREN5_14010 [Gemmatimonadales bacterium]
MIPRSASLAAALLGALAVQAGAQNSANVNATITITPSLTVTAVRDMDFGSVPQGVTNILISQPEFDVRSAHVQVQAVVGEDVVAAFVLPTELSDGAGHAIPITQFYGTFAAIGQSLISFTPTNQSVSPAAIVGTDGLLDLYLGAALNVSPNQFPATYMAVVQVSVFYN